MPGSIVLATPTTVFPFSLSLAYQRQKTWEVISSFFPDGSNQRSGLVASSRNTWVLTKRLTAAQMGTLRAFYAACKGPQVTFYFYDLFDANFEYDPSGVQTLGRYIARFQGGLQVTGDYPRVNAQFTIIEVD